VEDLEVYRIIVLQLKYKEVGVDWFKIGTGGGLL
jgi:hypothetical protein